MDPTTWPLLVKLLAGWGPLGIWVIRAELRANRAEREHHRTRTLHERAAEIVDAEHQKELRVLTDRFVRLIERQSQKAHELVEKVAEKTTAIALTKRKIHDEDITPSR